MFKRARIKCINCIYSIEKVGVVLLLYASAENARTIRKGERLYCFITSLYLAQFAILFIEYREFIHLIFFS
jgi:hypothetical protein